MSTAPKKTRRKLKHMAKNGPTMDGVAYIMRHIKHLSVRQYRRITQSIYWKQVGWKIKSAMRGAE